MAQNVKKAPLLSLSKSILILEEILKQGEGED